MTVFQKMIPILDQDRNQILGGYLLDNNVGFNGTETTIEIDGIVVNLMKYDPPLVPNRQAQEWFMVAVFTRQEITDKAYQGFTTFKFLKDSLPSRAWSSSSGAGTFLNAYEGTFAYGLERTFAVSMNADTPKNLTAPQITGTPSPGQVLTVSNPGTWNYNPTSYNYQWQRNGVNIFGATNVNYTQITGDSGQILRCLVSGVNDLGVGEMVPSNAMAVL